MIINRIKMFYLYRIVTFIKERSIFIIKKLHIFLENLYRV